MPTTTNSHRFPKTARLLRRRDFAALRRPSVRRETPSFRLAFRRSEAASARLGLAVSRRVGPAVVRNRIKRCVREAFRQLELPPVSILVAAKPEARVRAAQPGALQAELTPVLLEGALRAARKGAPRG